MLVRADPKNNTLSLLSFPRDLVVPIYCEGDTVVHARPDQRRVGDLRRRRARSTPSST